jgi:two-component system, response regulator YesN
MLKLMIVDDDPIARKSIIATIEWEKSGFTVVGEAVNGHDAYKLAKIHIPDIVITDIKMPVEDGLSLSRKILHNYPKTKVILLSGYEDFSYARQAIKIGVEEYLLKPFEVEDLLVLVQKLGTEIYKERKMNWEEDTKTRMLKENFQQIRSQFLNDLINAMVEPESELRAKSEFLGIRLDGIHYLLVIIDINELYKEKTVELNSIMLLIERTLIGEFNVVTFCNEEGAIIILLNMKTVNNYRIDELFEQCAIMMV